MGADGPGKAEIAVEEIRRARVFCDEWEQASHGGEITGAVHDGLLDRGSVTDLGRVLLGEVPGRTSPDEVTLFDSTGLAIQDLAIVLGLMERIGDGALQPRVHQHRLMILAQRDAGHLAGPGGRRAVRLSGRDEPRQRREHRLIEQDAAMTAACARS